MRRARWIFLFLVLGVFLGAAAGLAAAGSGAEEAGRQPQADLAWFMAGLRDLCRSKDARLKLAPGQAKAILAELQALVDEGILVVDPKRLETGSRAFTPGQGQRQSGGPSEEQRRQMQERRRREAERIEKAIERMEKALRQPQADYILNIDFDPKPYGLVFTSPGGTGSDSAGSFNQADFERWRKAMEEGRRRLIQLNKEVFELVKKLAK